ncbi:hypothetical protein [Alteromonas phage ZP6]|uniref:Uncharacterized protein n=1 Tax=Alteromonas phage ZP6 TaxID=2492447 RepID=A0A7D7KGD5_9CAUD|nr:hypothetical protein PQC03_gp01 [Alteromonas phage ZP6]QMS42074.1 hypothetical protein [Alteromonas phage ZP6]
MNTLWDTSLPNLKRSEFTKPEYLEYRELHLNERLLNKYYVKQQRVNRTEFERIQRKIGT